MLKIQKIKTKKTKIQQCLSAKHGILPTHPFRTYIVGASGSGKTNLLLNLLTRQDFYKDYFDHIFVISPTACHLDDSYRVLDLPEENYFQPDVNVLSRIRQIQEKTIKKKGIEKSPKVCIVLDDIVSYKKFCNSKVLLKFAIMSRHYGISMFILSQAYHRVPKSIRLNMSCIIFFRGSQKETGVLCEDLCPPSYSNKQFIDKINYATKERYEFLFIDLNRSIEEARYRKNLDETLI